MLSLRRPRHKPLGHVGPSGVHACHHYHHHWCSGCQCGSGPRRREPHFHPPLVRPGRSARPSPFPRGRTPRPSSCWRRPRGPGCSLHPGICGCCPIIISITITIIIISIGCISPIQHQHHHHNHYHHYHRLHQPPFSISIIMHCICSRFSSSVCSILFRVRIRGATLLARNGDWISRPNRNDGCISPCATVC